MTSTRPRIAWRRANWKRSTRWALVRTAELLERAQTAYNEYAFHKVYRGVYDFATVDLSSFYFDILKDRLYTAPAGSVRRRAAQTTLYRIADALVRVLAPLLCFTADEVWTHLPAPQLREKSVHLAKFVSPTVLRAGLSAEQLERLENWPLPDCPARGSAEGFGGGRARINSSAGRWKPAWSWWWVTIFSRLVEQYRDFLRYLFIVSQVEITIKMWRAPSRPDCPACA